MSPPLSPPDEELPLDLRRALQRSARPEQLPDDVKVRMLEFAKALSPPVAAAPVSIVKTIAFKVGLSVAVLAVGTGIVWSQTTKTQASKATSGVSVSASLQRDSETGSTERASEALQRVEEQTDAGQPVRSVASHDVRVAHVDPAPDEMVTTVAVLEPITVRSASLQNEPRPSVREDRVRESAPVSTTTHSDAGSRARSPQAQDVEPAVMREPTDEHVCPVTGSQGEAVVVRTASDLASTQPLVALRCLRSLGAPRKQDVLGEERRLLEWDVLRRLDRMEEARSVAEQILRDAPESAFAARMRVWLEEHPR